jgi:hypothetical protein
MHEAAARINNVRHIAVALGCIWPDQWFRQAADNLCRVVAIQQESADAVLSHCPHSVTDYQPAGFGFNGRAAVSQLDEFPGERGLQNELHGMPEMEMIGE